MDMLDQNQRNYGWAASSELNHYDALWTRDAAFTSLGALTSDKDSYYDTTRRSLLTLAGTQGRRGQIAAVMWPSRQYWDWGEMGASDASSLYVLMLGRYLAGRPLDGEVRALALPAARRSFEWLQSQDANNFGLIDSLGGSDWMDSSLNRSGKVLYNNVLYFESARTLDRLVPGEGYQETANEIKEKINILFWPDNAADYSRLLSHVAYPEGAKVHFPHPTSVHAYHDACVAERTFYLSHVNYGRFVDLCDVLANSLAILFGIPDASRERRIAEALVRSSAMDPYPARSYVSPISARSDRWQLLNQEADTHQDTRWQNPPHNYHNAGVWPFVGGFLVAALAKAGLVRESVTALHRLALANHLSEETAPWGFHEWIDSNTGIPRGTPRQSWNAASFIYAHKKVYSALRYPHN